MKKRYYQAKNGDSYVTLWETNCNICGKYIHESYPHEIIDDEIICGDCAFKNKHITESEYIKNHKFSISCNRAAVKDGKIYLLCGKDKKFPWEKTIHALRSTPEYAEWRTNVFERDSYTCAVCGKIGGELNAHHIKPFATYPDDALSVDNGVTLCITCHKKVHKEKNNEWIHIDKPEDR